MSDVVELLAECRRRRWSAEVGWICPRRSELYRAVVCAPGCTGKFFKAEAEEPFDALLEAMRLAELEVAA